jgi:hypothetical protein
MNSQEISKEKLMSPRLNLMHRYAIWVSDGYRIMAELESELVCKNIEVKALSTSLNIVRELLGVEVEQEFADKER